MAEARELTRTILGYTVADLVDVDGRPLGELASPGYDAVRTDVVPCPWPGHRQGLPMNRTALGQLTSCWTDLLGSIGWLAGPSPTVHRAWRATIAATCAPIVFRLTRDEPVPRTLSALYKASLGFTQVLTTVLLSDDGIADLRLADLGGAEDFLALLDDGRWLLGDQQVCAGPPGRIGEMFAALAEPRDPTPAAELLALGEPTWADPACAVFAVQAAAVATTYRALRRGERDGFEGSQLEEWLTGARAPALRALLAVPDRDPAVVRRLFPAGDAPTTLERFLAEGPGTPAAIEARLRRILQV